MIELKFVCEKSSKTNLLRSKKGWRFSFKISSPFGEFVQPIQTGAGMAWKVFFSPFSLVVCFDMKYIRVYNIIIVETALNLSILARAQSHR